MSADQKSTSRRLQLTRVFNAPRERVFSYWTRADTMQQWSGCAEAARCEVQMDFRVGGSFTQTMHMAGKGEFCGGTRVVLTQDGLPDAVLKHVTQGTGESMDKLETVLSRAADLASVEAGRR